MRGLHALHAQLGRLGLLGASSQESHPEILLAAKAVAASAGIAADCKEEFTLAPSVGGYYNRTCRAQCSSGQWTQYLFGADIWAEGSHQIPIIQLDVSRECGSTQVQYPTGGAIQTSSTQSTTQNTPTAPTVSITNTTRGGSSFQVGDRYLLMVRGAPNQPVTGTALQNGVNLGTSGYGSTDAAGTLSLNGQMDASTLGSWTEIWTVGGIKALPLSFQVTAPAAPPEQPKPSQPPTSPNSQDSKQQSSAPELPKWQTLQIGARKTATAIANTIKDPSSAALHLGEIPWWVWLAAGGAGIYALKRSEAF